MPLLIADRNINIRAAFTLIFQYCGWKDSIIEVSDAIELTKYHEKYKPRIILLGCNFLNSNTTLFAARIKEIDRKVRVAIIVNGRISGNKEYENVADYLITKDQDTKKIVGSISKIINNDNKQKEVLK